MLVCRPHDGRGRQLRDGDVIRVPVRAERIERHDHLRPDAPYVAGDLLARLRRIDAIQLAIEIIQQAHVGHTKLTRCGTQLGLARLPDNRGSGRCAFVVKPSALASSRRDDECLDAFARVLREHASRPERLVIRVSEDTHQPKHHRPQF